MSHQCEDVCYIKFENEKVIPNPSIFFTDKILEFPVGELPTIGADPGFPRVPILKAEGESQPIFRPNFPKNCMEIKKIGPKG